MAGALPQTERASCCQKMAGQEQNDCGKGKTKSSQDRQCCAICALGLGLLVTNAAALPARPVVEQPFAIFIFGKADRKERPPTPPPRRALV